ncbi:hypothetical protein NSP71_26470, partial [Salmonella enterica]|nr:hypothetical protein [Salmonella enterica]
MPDVSPFLSVTILTPQGFMPCDCLQIIIVRHNASRLRDTMPTYVCCKHYEITRAKLSSRMIEGIIGNIVVPGYGS